MVINFDTIREALIKLYEVFKNFLSFIRERWEAVKEFIMRAEPHYQVPIHPAFKVKFVRKQKMFHQVLINKPMRAIARSNC